MKGAKEGSISFLKKRNKKLLFCWPTRTPENKSFLVLFFKKELLLFLPVLFFASPSVCRAQPGWGLQPLMAELARVSSASARFSERKTMQVLNAPMVASGTLTYIAPDEMRKTTLSPVAEQFVLDHDTVSMTGGPDNQTQKFSLAVAPQIAGLVEGIRATLAGDLPTLEKFYAVQLTGTEAAWRLNLLPRNAESARFLTSIDMLGNGERIGEIDTKSPNGDHSEMTIVEDAKDAK
jgi:outer membrane lipoprotein-sorting protein